MLLYHLGEKRKSRLPSVRLSLLLINQTTTFKELLNRLYYSPVQDKRYHDHYVFVFVLYYRDFTVPNYVFTIISVYLFNKGLCSSTALSSLLSLSQPLISCDILLLVLSPARPIELERRTFCFTNLAIFIAAQRVSTALAMFLSATSSSS